MSEQISFIGKELFSDEEIAEMKKQTSVLIEKRNWENAFQRWSDEQGMDGAMSYGCCGYGSMCNWCKDNSYGRPCVRALNAMCREKHLTINYKQRDFETLWNRGVPRKGV